MPKKKKKAKKSYYVLCIDENRIIAHNLTSTKAITVAKTHQKTKSHIVKIRSKVNRGLRRSRLRFNIK